MTMKKYNAMMPQQRVEMRARDAAESEDVPLAGVARVQAPFSRP
jgi:hypothetical protein